MKHCVIDLDEAPNKANSELKMAQRDIYQRKAYATRRMSLAVIRLSQASSPTEKDMARYWVRMWSAISTIRQFKLDNSSRNRGGFGRQ